MSIEAALTLVGPVEGERIEILKFLERLRTEVETSGKWGPIGCSKCAPGPRSGWIRDR
jgi:hypothetical protein